MSMFDEIEAELGIDPVGVSLQLATDLVAADRDMIEALISLRVKKNISQSAVAETLGRHRSAVSNFERLGADPHLSTIRRYAAAVGARVRHFVEDADDPTNHLTEHGGWISYQVRTDDVVFGLSGIWSTTEKLGQDFRVIDLVRASDEDDVAPECMA